MASNKSGIDNINAGPDKSLGEVLIKIIAYGVAGGALLISGAKQIGEALLSKEDSDKRKLEEQREADKAEVRRIVENDPNEQ